MDHAFLRAGIFLSCGNERVHVGRDGRTERFERIAIFLDAWIVADRSGFHSDRLCVDFVISFLSRRSDHSAGTLNDFDVGDRAASDWVDRVSGGGNNGGA